MTFRSEAMFGSITTNKEVKRLARELAKRGAVRVFPKSLGGTSFGELEKLAMGSTPGDRCVYIVLSLDHTKGRLGRGREHQRMLDHLGAVISRLSPSYVGPRWPIPQSLIDLVCNNGMQLPYAVLADGMSVADSKAAEQRIFDHFGIGGFLINPWKR